jgi:putative NADH-flavin reductase
MKIALLGATRGTGRQVLEQALERGHEVRALVRDAKALTVTHPKLEVVQGDALNAADVAKVVQGADAVVSSLGASKLWSTARTVSKGAAATVEAMRQHGVKRVIFVSVRGAGKQGFVASALVLLASVLVRGVWDNVLEDKNRSERIFEAADLDYTFVRAPGMTDGPKTGRYRTLLDGSMGRAEISRADLGVFIVDELEQRKFVRAAPIVLSA